MLPVQVKDKRGRVMLRILEQGKRPLSKIR